MQEVDMDRLEALSLKSRMRDVVQSLWIGPSLSNLERLSVASFLANGHPYHLYVYDKVEGVPAGAVIKDANEILPARRIFKYRQFNTYSGFANHFRYKLLYERGGYWADTDMVCLRPFDFSADHVLATQRLPWFLWMYGDRWCVNNCLIKAPVGSDIMREAWMACEAADPLKLEWGDTGPTLLSRLVRQRDHGKHLAPADVFCPIDWWRIKDLHGSSRLSRWRIRRILFESYAVHFWNEMWRRSGTSKDGSFGPGSLYEQLKRRYGGLWAQAAVQSAVQPTVAEYASGEACS